MDKIELKLWKKVYRWLFLFRMVPFLKMVCVSNSLSFGVVDEKSDIDVFIITTAGRLYTARFFLNLFLKVFRLRVSGRKVFGRFCLSFIVDEKNVDLSNFMIGDDVYLYFWTKRLLPILDRGGLRKFEEVNGSQLDLGHLKKPGGFFRGVSRILESLFGGLEEFLRKRQISHVVNKLKIDNDSTKIIFTDGVFKVHLNDMRENIRDAYRKIDPNGMDEKKFISLLRSLKSPGK